MCTTPTFYPPNPSQPSFDPLIPVTGLIPQQGSMSSDTNGAQLVVLCHYRHRDPHRFTFGSTIRAYGYLVEKINCIYGIAPQFLKMIWMHDDCDECPIKNDAEFDDMVQLCFGNSRDGGTTVSIRIHDQCGGLEPSVSSHSAPTVIADDAVTVSRHVRSPRNGDGDRRSIGNTQSDISGPHGHTIPTRPMSPTVDISDSGLDGDRSNSQLDTSEESSSSFIPPTSINSDSDTMSDVLSLETLSTNASPVRAANTLLNGITNCSGCGGAFDLLRYVCDTCGEKGCTAGSHFTHECVDGGLHSPDYSPLQSPTRSSSSTCVLEYMLCVDCFNSHGYDHTMSMSTRAASNSRTQLRHAFFEQFCMDGCWVDIGKRWDCAVCEDYILCLACYRLRSSTSVGELSIGSSTDTTRPADENRRSCNGCKQPIIGAQYRCVSCPSKSPLYYLCDECDQVSFILHDPCHIFVKIRGLDGAREIPSLSSISGLYKSPAGPSVHTSTAVKHKRTVCQRHPSHSISGKWFHCPTCPADLCSQCEEDGAHDASHALIVFKAPVNMDHFNIDSGTFKSDRLIFSS
ncbi:hypothetical protein HETIRDRAFT_151559 [Heterobasidion irregulare TC 32-1]|uniref:ZZ-type domain-containing protein n=1 Tax=Heterobasidion irregulare (strain TC 32-1) TaxID=747525 RepID=W4JZK0_HETIT|nr:uncharacterized protein HETIRDRAFT_151559 [Heterobasidion irregulare TC 32-1]ETW79008.1 hypothetical protein HETIRDRAFT_151559 [Heterobasidion irregulare TC 32-1]